MQILDWHIFYVLPQEQLGLGVFLEYFERALAATMPVRGIMP